MKKIRIWLIALTVVNLCTISWLLLNPVRTPHWIPSIKAESEVESPLLAVQDQFNRVSAEVLPSIVEINVETFLNKESGEPVPWEDFFDLPQGEDTPPQDIPSYGLGSGIIVRKIDNTYYVLSNYHVTGEALELGVTLLNGDFYEGAIVGTDERKDLALVSFESEDDLPIAKLADSDDLRVGDWVLAMGSPLGYKSSVTFGIISALGRTESPDGNINDFIQTDAAINQGNSGGALVNIHGEVIGVNTWISTSTGGNMGLAFSIPINNAKKNIDDFIEFGEIQYGWLGVSIGDVNEYLSDDLQLMEYQGVLVFQTFQDSPAAKAGIEPGDLILSLNGEEAVNRKRLTYRIGELYPGEKAVFEVYREGRILSLTANITRRASENSLGQLSSLAWPGITLLPLNQRVKDALELDADISGVMVDQIYPQTPFQQSGIKSGDVIIQLGQKDIQNMADFYSSLRNQGQVFEVKVNRLDDDQEVTLLVERK